VGWSVVFSEATFVRARVIGVFCVSQMFTSGAVRDGSAGFWALVVFVGGVISFAILAMFVLIGFETVRAFRFAHLYQDIRCVTHL
jgi:hypothetical protein